MVPVMSSPPPQGPEQMEPMTIDRYRFTCMLPFQMRGFFLFFFRSGFNHGHIDRICSSDSVLGDGTNVMDGTCGKLTMVIPSDNHRTPQPRTPHQNFQARSPS